MKIIVTSFLFCVICSLNANSQLTGNHYIGTTNALDDFSTITAAVSSASSQGISGPVVFYLTDANYNTSTNETFPVTFTNIPNLSATNNLTIKPYSGVNAVISSNSTSAIVKISGQNFITIDGDNGDHNRDLTITNTNSSANQTSTAVVWLASTSPLGATNNTIQNCIITGSANNYLFSDIFSGGTSIGTGTASYPAQANSSNIFRNNSITKALYGLYATGSATLSDVQLQILTNLFGSSTLGDGFTVACIFLKYQTSAIVSGNDVQNLASSSSPSFLDGKNNAIVAGVYLFDVTFSTVSSNKIHNIKCTGGTKRCYSLSLESPQYNTSSSKANNVVYNNMIYDGSNTAAVASWQYSGINENGGYGDQFYFNSVNLYGAFSNSAGSVAAFSNGNLLNATASPYINIENNIFNIVGFASGNASSSFYCDFSKLSTPGMVAWNYNDFYYDPASVPNGYVGSLVVSGTQKNEKALSDWRSATGMEVNSQQVSPAFRSNTDLHINNCGNGNSLFQAGSPISQNTNYSTVTITTDFDGDTRASTPDIGADEFSSTITYWIGNTTDWNTASNWSCGSVPISTSDVYIPVTNNQPVFSATTPVAIHNLYITGGATVSMNDQTLTLNGTINGTGSFIGSALSNLNITGTGTLNAGTLYFTPAIPNNQLFTLTVANNRTVTIGSDTLNIVGGSASGGYGTVTANGTLNSNGHLTLRSNSAGTARVATGTGSINGDVTVERFIPAHRAWRFLGLPFQTSLQTINTAWQEGVHSNSIYVQIDPHPGYGTEITYNTYTHDFDANTTSNASCFDWLNTTAQYGLNPISGTDINMLYKDAYVLFVRGGRSVDLSLVLSAPPTNTVLRVKGQLYSGAFIKASYYSDVIANNWFLAGNPYASSIDISKVLSDPNSSGVTTSSYYTWNSSLAGSYNVGGYVTHNISSNLFVPVFNPTDIQSNDPTIQSGEAVVLKATTNSPLLSFNENDKVANESTVNFGSAVNTMNNTVVPKKIYINLLSGDSANVLDGVLEAYAGIYSPRIDSNDVLKLRTFAENLTLTRNDTALAIETKYVPSGNDTIFLRSYRLSSPSYVLKIFATNIPVGFPTATLIDKYLNVQQSINLYDSTLNLYNFSVTSDSSTFYNRFIIVLSHDSAMQQHYIAKTLSDSTDHAIIKVFPNPVSSQILNLYINNLRTGNYNVKIIDMNGTCLLQNKIMSNDHGQEFSFPISKSFSNGVHTLFLYNNNGEMIASTKLVIAR